MSFFLVILLQLVYMYDKTTQSHPFLGRYM